MRKIRLEWTDFGKSFSRATVNGFIDGKGRVSSVVTLDRKGNYKLGIGNGWITGNVSNAKKTGIIPMKTSRSSGRFRHRLDLPIDITQVKLGPRSGVEVLQECVASEVGVCPCGRIEWFLET